MVVPKHRYRASPSWEAIRPFTIVFMNGARMYCKGLKDPESARGANLNWFWYDEGRRDPTGLGWKNAIAFLRVGNLPQAWCTTTMASLDHWTNTFFKGEVTPEIKKLIEQLKQSGSDQNLFSIHKTSPKENEDNLSPGYYLSLVSANPSGYLRIREVDGEAADEGGSLGTREWFENKELPEIPDWAVKFTRFWDLAATEKKILKGKKLNDPDETVGSLLGTDSEKDVTKKRFAICDQAGGYLAWKQLKEFVLDVARRDINKLGMVTICFEQEPASGGKNQVAELKEFLEKELKKRWGITTNQFKVEALEAKKLGDRVLAANTWFSEANNGQFYYVKGVWNEKFFGQLDTFDGLRHDDRITSVTGARHNIAPIQNKFRDMEFLAL
jgi:phage terminase large subunit-like protein